jgi:restriction system protein
MTTGRSIIPAHGGYEKLKSYQMAEIVYDATVKFCDRFINKRSRTIDQMVQAARSGKQNIAEGSMASGTSKKTELKLVGVARASLEELLIDYKDYIRQHDLKLCGKDDSEAIKIRRLGSQENRSYRTYVTYIEEKSDEVAANTMVCVINQANYLLDQQLRQLEQSFLHEGGITERLYKVRKELRDNEEHGIK